MLPLPTRPDPPTSVLQSGNESSPTTTLRPLIAILACHHHRNLCQIQRDTWLQKSPIPHRFFLGTHVGEQLETDTIYLDCPDDYAHLPQKVWGLIRWAVSNGFTHIFKTDDETYVRPERLLHALLHGPPAACEYTGRVETDPRTGFQWCNGGPGYWIGPISAAFLSGQPCPPPGAEDRWVSSALLSASIRPHGDSRYVLPGVGMEPPHPSNDIISYTSTASNFDGVPTMREIHRQWL